LSQITSKYCEVNAYFEVVKEIIKQKKEIVVDEKNSNKKQK
jgi:hypothetical protein